MESIEEFGTSAPVGNCHPSTRWFVLLTSSPALLPSLRVQRARRVLFLGGGPSALAAATRRVAHRLAGGRSVGGGCAFAAASSPASPLRFLFCRARLGCPSGGPCDSRETPPAWVAAPDSGEGELWRLVEIVAGSSVEMEFGSSFRSGMRVPALIWSLVVVDLGDGLGVGGRCCEGWGGVCRAVSPGEASFPSDGGVCAGPTLGLSYASSSVCRASSTVWVLFFSFSRSSRTKPSKKPMRQSNAIVRERWARAALRANRLSFFM